MKASPSYASDDDLAAIQAPLLVLLPALDRIYEPMRAFARVRRLLPHADVEVVPGAGHFVSMEAAEQVSSRLLDLLGEHGTA